MNSYTDERLAAAYQSGNEMPADSLRGWAELFLREAPVPASGTVGLRLVEVGAGTGMFCAALADLADGALVVGIEPAAPMLAEAVRRNARPRVRYLAGSAEALPVADAGFDLALLSRVVHHLPDRPAAAREMLRVLRPGGRLVIRTTFRERLDALVYTYWPRLRETDAGRFPAEREVLADFTAAGFTVHRVFSQALAVARDLGEFRDRLTDRPQSKFLALTEREFAEGLARLSADALDARRAAAAQPVRERYDLVVLERPRETAPRGMRSVGFVESSE
ncbi:ubiquinone/menaquinone biosynthesis C-methylase UbiE [Kitasatospora sp. MAA4]|uniref:class I SAM-dependent methyltransferase n=1 Tax=Kitasatospora sp. MAA4 TaxID=3035093 RepID=UPI002474ACFD|nr:class I SAM-dependent methyltransferase [Kitasatospora sp. MAA4]MDH6131200.1 ubiquinone/menaquinone biosynthesis C-methylase UbiE [Kitasatospora sp. MAA4]